MTALAADRNNLKAMHGTVRGHPVAATTTIYKGALVCKVGGYAAPALNTTGYSNVIGVATEYRSNASGSAGDVDVPVQSGISVIVAMTGAVQAAENNQIVYVADDQTVSTVVNSGAQAGYLEGYVASGTVRIFIPLGGMHAA